MNIYKDIVEQSILRLLTQANLNPASRTKGYADRSFWAWRIKDFPNATMQGGVHALAAAHQLGMISNKDFLLKTIDEMIIAVSLMTTSKGSLAESYPREHSFCVTALVAFDILSAVELLQSDISEEKKSQYLKVVEPLISFISKHPENHAIISNHLATAAVAIALWNQLSDSDNETYQVYLKVIYENQSSEGWYREYEGADPGYQTLCTYYLARLYEITKDEELKESLIKSAGFLKYFIHPDGTIGGLYGSRNTEVYYPGGIILMREHHEDFALLAASLERGLADGRHILPQHIDSGNFVPLLNAYAQAALVSQREELQFPFAPCKEVFERDFKEAGVFIKSTPKYFSIVNYHKGGTLKVFDQETGKLDIEDGGLLGELASGRYCSTQGRDAAIDFSDRKIVARFYQVTDDCPNAFGFMVLRFLSLTFFHSVSIGKIFKKWVVGKLMTKNKSLGGEAIRKFDFTDEKIIVTEEITPPPGCQDVKHAGKFTGMQMASSGYLSRSSQEAPENPQRVIFQ